jgi:hypothetical protein
MKLTTALKMLIALPLIIGFPCPLISAELLQMNHAVWFTPICYASAFIGVGLVFGFQTYYPRPKMIGNLNQDIKPQINQTWVVFFISLICNLTFANLC